MTTDAAAPITSMKVLGDLSGECQKMPCHQVAEDSMIQVPKHLGRAMTPNQIKDMKISDPDDGGMTQLPDRNQTNPYHHPPPPRPPHPAHLKTGKGNKHQGVPS